MAGSQTAATLDVRMRMETGEFVAGATKAAQETTKLKNAITREMNAAQKEIQALSFATEDYGKNVTKVALIERELAAGRYKNLQSSEQGKAVAAQLLAQAAAYDKVAAATRAANKGLTEQQRIQLSYQLTDFVTQVGSGQNAMVAFLQQGGQFKDVMGGFGNTFKWLGTLITPFRVAVGGAATALGVLIAAFYKGSDESAKFRDNLILTNNYAGLTEQSILSLAKASSEKLNVSIGGAKDSLYALSASGKFTQASISSVNEMILRMSKLTGESADKVAEKLIPALNGTASSAKSLNDKYHFLTLEQYKQIEALEKQAKAQEAIKLQADAFNEKTGDQTRNLGLIERAWNAIGREINDAWEALKNFGKENLEQELASVQRQIRELHESQASMAKAGGFRSRTPSEMSSDFDLSLLKLNARAQEIQARIDGLNKQALRAQEATRQIDVWNKAGGLSAFLGRQDELVKLTAQSQVEIVQEYANTEYKLLKEASAKVNLARYEMRRKNEETLFQFAATNAQILAQQEFQIEQKLLRDIKALRDKREEEIAKGEYERFQEQLEAQEEYQRKVGLATRALDVRLDLERQSIDLDKEKIAFQNTLLFATEAEKKSAQERYQLEKDILKMQKDTSISDKAKDTMARKMRENQDLRDELNKFEEATQRVGEKWTSVFDNMTKSIEQFVRTGKLSFRDLARGIIQELILIEMKMQSTMLFGLLRNSLKSMFASNTSFTTTGTAFDIGAVAAGRAAGGPVSSNTPYLVGERGPELFMPSSAGTIVPNHAMSGMGAGTSITNNYIQAIDVKSFEDRIYGSAKAVWAANQYANKGFATSGGRA